MKRLVFPFLLLAQLCSAQGMLGIGANLGYRTNGPYVDFSFAQRFRLQTGLEVLRYSSFGSFVQLRGNVYQSNTSKHSAFVAVAANQFFATKANILRDDVLYEYVIYDNLYLIPAIGYQFSLPAYKENTRIKWASLALLVSYRINLNYHDPQLIYVSTTQPVDPDVDRSTRNYVNGGIGVYVSYGVSLGKKSRSVESYSPK